MYTLTFYPKCESQCGSIGGDGGDGGAGGKGGIGGGGEGGERFLTLEKRRMSEIFPKEVWTPTDWRRFWSRTALSQRFLSVSSRP